METMNNKIRKRVEVFRKVISTAVAVTFIVSSVYTPGVALAKVTNSPIVNMPQIAAAHQYVDSFIVPKNNGSVKDSYKGPNGKLIIHIQDAHTNYDGQKNIAQIVRRAVEEQGISLVLVEGASGNASLSFLRHFSTTKMREEIAGDYLRRGKLAGEEYLDIVSDPGLRFSVYGIEDSKLYKSNLEQFLRVDGFAAEANGFIDSIERSLLTLKDKIYSPELKEFEGTRKLYDGEKIDAVAYCAFLENISKEAPAGEIGKLLSVKRIEDSIDFDVVNGERDRLITLLSKKLSGGNLNGLLKMSVDFKADAISPKDYYCSVKKLGADAGVDMKKFPNLQRYIYYITVFEGVNNDRLFRELGALEESVLKTLCKNDRQKRLVDITGGIALIRNLVNLRLSPADLTKFKAAKSDYSFKDYAAFMNGAAKEANLPEAFVTYADVVDKNLNELERFYDIAGKRDAAFKRNATAVMEKMDQERAILITGGFHTDHLMPLFKEEGYSYIVVSPKIVKETDLALYRSLLRGKLTPEEQMVKDAIGALRVPAIMSGLREAERLPLLLKITSGQLAIEGISPATTGDGLRAVLNMTQVENMPEGTVVGVADYIHIADDVKFRLDIDSGTLYLLKGGRITHKLAIAAANPEWVGAYASATSAAENAPVYVEDIYYEGSQMRIKFSDDREAVLMPHLSSGRMTAFWFVSGLRDKLLRSGIHIETAEPGISDSPWVTVSYVNKSGASYSGVMNCSAPASVLINEFNVFLRNARPITMTSAAEESSQASVRVPEILLAARISGLILKTYEVIEDQKLVSKKNLPAAFAALAQYARYATGKELLPAGQATPEKWLEKTLTGLGMKNPKTLFSDVKKEVEEALTPGKLAELAEEYEGLCSKPEVNSPQKQPINLAAIPKVPAQELPAIRERVRQAQERGEAPFVEAHMRGWDVFGTSLDLPFFQWMLTKLGARKLSEFPKTLTVASKFKAKISFKVLEPGHEDEIEYIAPQYGIEKLVLRESQLGFNDKHQVINMEAPGENSMKVAPHFIFMKMFGLKGFRVIVEDVDLLPKEGGAMESSNVALIALISAASMISGASLSEADIFNLAVKLENDELGGLTGGQGHRCAQQGGIAVHVWMSGAKNADGELFNPYSSYSIPLIKSKAAVRVIERCSALVQPGKKYKDGKALIGRLAALTNELWTAGLADFDEAAYALHFEKLGVTEEGIQALRVIEEYAERAEQGNKEAQKKVREALETIIKNANRYVDIRDEITLRMINLVLDAYHHGEPGIPDVPEYAMKYPEAPWFEYVTDLIKDLAKSIAEEQGISMEEATKAAEQRVRTDSLYTFGEIGKLREGLKKEGVLLMPLGAGSIGSICIGISSVIPGITAPAVPGKKDHIVEVLESQGLPMLTNQIISNVVNVQSHQPQGAILAGFVPFEVGEEPATYGNFANIGFQLPEKPKAVSWSKLRANRFKLSDIASATSAAENAPVYVEDIYYEGSQMRIKFSDDREAVLMPHLSSGRMTAFWFVSGLRDKLLRSGIHIETAEPGISDSPWVTVSYVNKSGASYSGVMNCSAPASVLINEFNVFLRNARPITMTSAAEDVPLPAGISFGQGREILEGILQQRGVGLPEGVTSGELLSMLYFADGKGHLPIVALDQGTLIQWMTPFADKKNPLQADIDACTKLRLMIVYHLAKGLRERGRGIGFLLDKPALEAINRPGVARQFYLPEDFSDVVRDLPLVAQIRDGFTVKEAAALGAKMVKSGVSFYCGPRLTTEEQAFNEAQWKFIEGLAAESRAENIGYVSEALFMVPLAKKAGEEAYKASPEYMRAHAEATLSAAKRMKGIPGVTLLEMVHPYPGMTAMSVISESERQEKLERLAEIAGNRWIVAGVDEEWFTFERKVSEASQFGQAAGVMAGLALIGNIVHKVTMANGAAADAVKLYEFVGQVLNTEGVKRFIALCGSISQAPASVWSGLKLDKAPEGLMPEVREELRKELEGQAYTSAAEEAEGGIAALRWSANHNVTVASIVFDKGLIITTLNAPVVSVMTADSWWKAAKQLTQIFGFEGLRVNVTRGQLVGISYSIDKARVEEAFDLARLEREPMVLTRAINAALEAIRVARVSTSSEELVKGVSEVEGVRKLVLTNGMSGKYRSSAEFAALLKEYFGNEGLKPSVPEGFPDEVVIGYTTEVSALIHAAAMRLRPMMDDSDRITSFINVALEEVRAAKKIDAARAAQGAKSVQPGAAGAPKATSAAEQVKVERTPEGALSMAFAPGDTVEYEVAAQMRADLNRRYNGRLFFANKQSMLVPGDSEICMYYFTSGKLSESFGFDFRLVAPDRLEGAINIALREAIVSPAIRRAQEAEERKPVTVESVEEVRGGLAIVFSNGSVARTEGSDAEGLAASLQIVLTDVAGNVTCQGNRQGGYIEFGYPDQAERLIGPLYLMSGGEQIRRPGLILEDLNTILAQLASEKARAQTSAAEASSLTVRMSPQEAKAKLREYLDALEPHEISAYNMAGGRLLGVVPFMEEAQEGREIRHIVPSELYNLNESMWEGACRELNDAGSSNSYKIDKLMLSELSGDGAADNAEEIFGQLMAALADSSSETTVLYLSRSLVERLGQDRINRLERQARLVSYGEYAGRAVFIRALIGYGEVLRNIRTRKDLVKYGKIPETLYRLLTGKEMSKGQIELFGCLASDSDGFNIYRFLMELFVDFPPITPQLQEELLRYQKDRLIEAVTQIAL